MVRVGILLLLVSGRREDIGESPPKTVNCFVKDEVSKVFCHRSGPGVRGSTLGVGERCRGPAMDSLVCRTLYRLPSPRFLLLGDQWVALSGMAIEGEHWLFPHPRGALLF